MGNSDSQPTAPSPSLPSGPVLSSLELDTIFPKEDMPDDLVNFTQSQDPRFSVVPKQKVILISDVGSDADDCLALLTLFHLPKDTIDLLGIICCYGQTPLRKRITEHMCDLAQLKVPIIAGTSTPLGTSECFWHSDYEGFGVLSPDEINSLMVELPKVGYGTNFKESEILDKVKMQEAADFLVQTINKYPKEVVIIAIGGVSDLAIAFLKDPSLPSKIKRTAFMGCGIPRTLDIPKGQDHTIMRSQNVRHDMLAANIVFDRMQNCPMLVISGSLTRNPDAHFNVTKQTITKLLDAAKNFECDIIGLSREDILKKSNGIPSETIVAAINLHYWLKYTSKFTTTPHDPLVCLEALFPGKYAVYSRGQFIKIDPGDGASTYRVDNEKGCHYAAVGVKTHKVLKDVEESFFRPVQ